MIEKILNKLGYIKVSSIDSDKVMELYANTVKNFDINIDEDTKKSISEELKSIEGISEFLDAVITRDMKSYFSVHTDKERYEIRGSYNRAMYFKSLIKKNKVPTKISGIRYGS